MTDRAMAVPLSFFAAANWVWNAAFWAGVRLCVRASNSAGVNVPRSWTATALPPGGKGSVVVFAAAGAGSPRFTPLDRPGNGWAGAIEELFNVLRRNQSGTPNMTVKVTLFEPFIGSRRGRPAAIRPPPHIPGELSRRFLLAKPRDNVVSGDGRPFSPPLRSFPIRPIIRRTPRRHAPRSE